MKLLKTLGIGRHAEVKEQVNNTSSSAPQAGQRVLYVWKNEHATGSMPISEPPYLYFPATIDRVINSQGLVSLRRVTDRGRAFIDPKVNFSDVPRDACWMIWDERKVQETNTYRIRRDEHLGLNTAIRNRF